MKVAFFVEGLSEMIFIDKFLQDYLGVNSFSYTPLEIKRGSNFIVFKGRRENPFSEHNIFIYLCGGDEKAVSELLERSEELINSKSYDYLFALRDLFPKKRNLEELIISTTLEQFQRTIFAEKLIFSLAVMEVEAWFLYDYEFFKKKDLLLTAQYISEKLNIDITQNPENFNHPAAIIKKVFKLVNLDYDKHEGEIFRICSRIDFSKFITETDMHSWDYLFNQIELIMD